MQNKTPSNHPQTIDADLGAAPVRTPNNWETPILSAVTTTAQYARNNLVYLPNILTSLPQCSRRHYLVCASSIFLQSLTPSTTTLTQKTVCLVLVLGLLTLLSSGFNPIPILALSPLRYRKHHHNHALSAVVFRKVQFLVPSCSSSTLLHSVHSSKHPQLTITYTPTTPNYSSPSLQTVSPNP